MLMVVKAYTSVAFIFFIPLVFIGAFFLLNLTLAVIKSKFSKEHEKNQEKKSKKDLFKERNEAKLKEDKDFEILPPEFENVDEEEEKKLKLTQKEQRPEVLKKWKMIMLIKRKMRINVRNFQKSRMQKIKEKMK